MILHTQKFLNGVDIELGYDQDFDDLPSDEEILRSMADFFTSFTVPLSNINKYEMLLQYYFRSKDEKAKNYIKKHSSQLISHFAPTSYWKDNRNFDEWSRKQYENNKKYLEAIIFKLNFLTPKGALKIFKYLVETEDYEFILKVLDYPYFIQKCDTNEIFNYLITKNKSELIYKLLYNKNTDFIHFINKENIQKIIEFSIQNKTGKLTALLLDYKHKNFPETESEEEYYKKFEL